METENKTKTNADTISRLKREFDSDKSAYEKRSKRIKRDLAYSSGSVDDHFSDVDDAIRGKDRAKIAIPVLDTFIRKMVSQYLANPYGMVLCSENKIYDELCAELSKDIAKVEKDSDAKYEYSDSLYMAGACGFGYLYVTTDVIAGKVVPLICGVADSRSVIFDRNSKRLNGSDAKRAAFVDYMSVGEAKAEHGEDITGAYGVDGFLTFPQQKTDAENCPVITIWEMRKETGTCWVVKIVGNKIIDEIDSKCPFLLVVPILGVKSLVNNVIDFVGIIHKAIGIQNMIDYTSSQMQERLALAPTTKWVIDKGSMDTETAKTVAESHRSLHPAILFNGKDSAGNPTVKPERVDPATNISDLSTALDSFISYASTSIGFNSSGIGDHARKNETAEAVLLRQKESETSIADIYSHLECSIAQLCKVLSYMIVANDPKYAGVDLSEIEFTTDAGPMLSTQRRDNLSRTMALLGMVDDPMEKKLLYADIAENADGVSDHTKQVFALISQKAEQSMSVGAGVDPAMMQQQADAMATMQEQVNQANIMIQNLQQQNYALSMGEQSKITVAQIKAETDRYVAEIKIAAGNEIEMQKIQERYAETMLKLNAEFEKALATKPVVEIVEGVKPRYNSVGGMESNLLG